MNISAWIMVKWRMLKPMTYTFWVSTNLFVGVQFCFAISEVNVFSLRMFMLPNQLMNALVVHLLLFILRKYNHALWNAQNHKLQLIQLNFVLVICLLCLKLQCYHVWMQRNVHVNICVYVSSIFLPCSFSFKLNSLNFLSLHKFFYKSMNVFEFLCVLFDII